MESDFPSHEHPPRPAINFEGLPGWDHPQLTEFLRARLDGVLRRKGFDPDTLVAAKDNDNTILQVMCTDPDTLEPKKLFHLRQPKDITQDEAGRYGTRPSAGAISRSIEHNLTEIKSPLLLKVQTLLTSINQMLTSTHRPPVLLTDHLRTLTTFTHTEKKHDGSGNEMTKLHRRIKILDATPDVAVAMMHRQMIVSFRHQDFQNDMNQALEEMSQMLATANMYDHFIYLHEELSPSKSTLTVRVYLNEK